MIKAEDYGLSNWHSLRDTDLTTEGLILPGQQVEAASPRGQVAPVAQLAALSILLATRETLSAFKLREASIILYILHFVCRYTFS